VNERKWSGWSAATARSSRARELGADRVVVARAPIVRQRRAASLDGACAAAVAASLATNILRAGGEATTGLRVVASLRFSAGRRFGPSASGKVLASLQPPVTQTSTMRPEGFQQSG